MRQTADPIVLAPEAILVEGTAPCEPCARCGLYYRLVRVGRRWMQPEHECRVSYEEAVNRYSEVLPHAIIVSINGESFRLKEKRKAGLLGKTAKQ